MTGEPGPGLETRTSQESGRIPVEEIEREFARLRMNEDGTLGLRSSVLNLIVVTDEESAADVTRTVSRLSGRFPSRAVVLISDTQETKENLEVNISAFCSIRGGTANQVCAEQVTIHAEGPPAHHLESLAGPLLLPDLPTFLWYPGHFDVRSPELASVASLAERLIVDPAAAQDRVSCLRGLRGTLEKSGIPALGDLQWVALSPWRSLVAELFHPPERAEMLNEIERVEILYSPRGEVRALLLAGWLASSLGWKPVERSSDGIQFSGPSGEVKLLMDSSSSDASLRRVRLMAGEWSFQVSRHRRSAEARSTVMRSGEPVGESTVRLGHFDLENILGEELQYRGRDVTYENALKMAVEILDL